MSDHIWKDRKRIFSDYRDSLPVMRLRKKLLIDTGFLSRNKDEIRLYRIPDILLKRSLWNQKMFGFGTIHCRSTDKSSPEFNILHTNLHSLLNCYGFGSQPKLPPIWWKKNKTDAASTCVN